MVMVTIKALVTEKLRTEGHSVEDNSVKESIRQYLEEICGLLPNETPEGHEFAEVMSGFLVNGNSDAAKVLIGKDAKALIEKSINTLLEKIMDERHDLRDRKYTHLRQNIVAAITRNRRDNDGVSYKGLALESADGR